jgi:hypothetical protein
MVLTGVLRHYVSVLMATAPKKQDEKAMREQRYLARGVALRSNHHVLSQKAFESRRDVLTTNYEAGTYLKEPDRKGQPPANPLSDPSAMDGMMGMMKNNMAMIVPNTLIMSWINAFFSGYVISMSNCLVELNNTNSQSETTFPHHHQVQEHAPGWCSDQGDGSSLDVQHQLVLPLHLWSPIRLRLPSR